MAGVQGGDLVGIRQRLADYLAARTEMLPGVGTEVTGELDELGGGFVNRIVAFRVRADSSSGADCELVLRLAPLGKPAGKFRREHELQQRAAACGIPTPESLLVEDDERILGGQFQIMRRAPGAPVLDGLAARPWAAAAAMARMAELLAQLHGVAIESLGLDGPGAEEATIERLAASEIPGPAVLRWLESHRPEDRTTVPCHLDFHPANVLAERGRVTALLDWENAAAGHPMHDLADARLVLVAAPTDLAPHLRPVELLARRGLAAHFVRRYRSAAAASSSDGGLLRYFTVMSAARRLLGAIEDAPAAGEVARGFTSPEYIATLSRIIEEHTGHRPRA